MTVLRCVKLLVLLVLSTIHVALAHVSLTFPPARKYDLDFLDNSRTKAPCGMPKGSIQTTILAGSSFNVTWHLAYPHRGGFRLQLLDDLERPVLDLTPSVNGSEFVRTDATAQSFEVHIPNDFTCHNCTLRLLRQADEWSSGYRFWSCADIDIKERKDFRETCSGNGKYFPSRCKCNKNFYGARCQYQDECTTNQDCGVQGQCIDLKGTSLPKKQCYCNFGWFGPGCNKKSPYKTTDIDLSGYSMRQLSPDYQLHWRILEDIKEIEFVLKVNGTSWVGLGWRPNNMTATCKHFPNIQESEEVGELRRNLEVAAEPEPEPEAAAEPEPEPEVAAEPEPKPEAAAEPEPEPEAAAEPEPEPEAAAEPEPEPKLTYEASSKTKRVAAGDDTTSKDGITVATSVSYRVSAKTGRKRRQAVTPSISPGNQGTGRPSIPTPEPTSEPEPASKSKDPTPEPNAEPEPASKSKDPTPEPNAEPEPASKSKDPTPEPNAEPEPASKSKDPTPEPNAEPEPASKSKDPTPEPTSEPEPENFPLPISKVQKSTAQSEGNYPSKAHPYTPRHDFNPMDCTDIVIGSARGKTSRVGDYYTRDRSTPRVDDFWGGKSDLTLGTGFEDNGITTIIFRKKLESTEPTDYSFIDDLTHVIWAKGQEPGSYVHEPPSGLEKDASSIQEFYQPDELKYHGHKMQRGLTQINFFEKEKSSETEEGGNVLDNECFGNWKYPKGCSQPDHSCEYYVSWETVGRGDAMRWYIETKHTQTWTGIGFSEDYKMSQTDAILGWVDRNGRHFLMDTTINGYSPPKIDEIQDIYNTSGRIEKGVTILEFTRKRNSNDKNQDLAFTEDHCLHLFFPVLGGAFNAVNKKIRKHEQIPFVTPERVCIKSCGKELETLIVGPITPTPSRLVYSVGVKLMNLAESFEAPEKGSPEFQTLASAVQDSFNGLLINIPGYHKLDIVNFEKDGTAMVAKMNAIFDKAAYEKGRSLKTNELSATNEDTIDVKDGEYIRRVFNESVTTGIVGSLTVDPHYLDFESLDYTTKSSSTESSSSFFQLSEVRLYTVLGCIAALVLIALIQASCTIYKTSKKNKNQKDQLIPNSAWKDYSSNTNYAFDAFGETEEKSNKTPSRSRNSAPPQTLQMSHSPTNKGQYYENNGRSSRFETNGLGSPDHHPPHYRYSNGDQIIPRSAYGDRAYSLPRTSIQHQGSMQQAYYTQDRRNKHNHHHTDRDRGDRGRNTSAGTDTPDFYFMPSQRKYSGEVVRVYVDYNKDPKH